MSRVVISGVLILGVAVIVGSLAVPTVLLLGVRDETLDRWSQIGQALSPVGVFFSGAAFMGIAYTLFLQARDLRNQGEELSIVREEQRRNSEIAQRELHTEIIRMAIEDPELREVWPQVSPGVQSTKKDHYCNLILNLQKVAYETRTIELSELRGALSYLMNSPDIYEFWAKARAARKEVTAGGEAEDFFTAEVDSAFANALPPPRNSLASEMREAIGRWIVGRRSRRRG